MGGLGIGLMNLTRKERKIDEWKVCYRGKVCFVVCCLFLNLVDGMEKKGRCFIFCVNRNLCSVGSTNRIVQNVLNEFAFEFVYKCQSVFVYA